jgi:putative membrane protein
MLKGLLMGTLTGMTPGIHVNTLAELGITSSFPALFAMGLTHTFLDAIPAAFLGVPDDGSALSLLPSHRLILKGRGQEVVEVAMWASFLAVVFSIPLSYVYRVIAPLYRPEFGVGVVVLLAVILILGEKGGKRTKALVIFLVSGVLGLAVFHSGNLNEPFYHLFTGFFGIPVLITASSSSPPSQEKGYGSMSPIDIWEFSLIGTVLGMIASLVPTMTASMAASLAVSASEGERPFLAVVYSVNTSNFLFGIINYHLTGRTRNGVVVAMKAASIDATSTLEILLMGVLVGVLAMMVGFVAGEGAVRALSRVNYRVLNAATLVLLLALSAKFDGIYGVWVILTAAGISYTAQEWGVRRTSCMGVLMLPVIVESIASTL